jgi:hypothetical protein
MAYPTYFYSIIKGTRPAYTFLGYNINDWRKKVEERLGPCRWPPRTLFMQIKEVL